MKQLLVIVAGASVAVTACSSASSGSAGNPSATTPKVVAHSYSTVHDQKFLNFAHQYLADAAMFDAKQLLSEAHRVCDLLYARRGPIEVAQTVANDLPRFDAADEGARFEGAAQGAYCPKA